MAIQMTREEYRRKYGSDPVFSQSTIDITPAPIRMTRAEYDSLYGEVPEPQKGLGGKLMDRASSVFSQAGKRDVYPGQTTYHGFGQLLGAAGDVLGEAISPVIDKMYKKDVGMSAPLSDKFKETRGNAVDTVKDTWSDFEKGNPNTGQFLRDTANIVSFLPFGKPIKQAGETIKPKLDERVIQNRANEIANIEGKYVKTRKANSFTDDAGEASRQRIAQTDVLIKAVDENGLIRTKNPGGAIDQYKAQTIDGVEDIVRKNLEQTKDVIDLKDVKTYLVREISSSGLEGGDLVQALRGVEKELAGLKVRTKGNSVIDLTYLQDAKIATTKNINYLTPRETSTFRKAVARAYKKVIEDKSTFKVEIDGKSVGIKEVNAELAKYYEDIKRLERLDGARVEGGKLGKYLAQGVGTAIGMGAGSVGGGAGSVIGGILGGEAGAFIKGKSMAGTFGRGTGKTAPKNAILEKAKLKVPDGKVKVPDSIKKTKEMSSLEDDIAKNVEAQKKAIAKGDFTLVKALKEIYQALVEALKAEIKRVQEMAKGQGERGFANFGAMVPQRKKALISDQNQAINPPKTTQSISSTVPKVTAEVKSNIVDIIDDYRLNGGKNLELQEDAAKIAEDFNLPYRKDYGRLVNELEKLLDENYEVKAWTGTESSKPSTVTNTSTSKKPTGKEDVSGQSAGTSGGFDGQYLYHGTNDYILDVIEKEGLKPGRRGQLSLSTTEDYAKSYAHDGMTPQGKTNAVLFRVKADFLKGKTTTTRLDGKERPVPDQKYELLTDETIPPEAIEIFKNGKWQPLKPGNKK